MGFKESGKAAAAGRKGAATVLDRLGIEWYSRMGKMGGASCKNTHTARNPNYYRDIGRKGAEKRWAAVRAAREQESG